jgi:endonuclease/exonuclease/phosphatase family metal-dependent hydrolase
MSELRLLTYNVRSLRDDVAALSRVVRECAPDVVAVQEAPRFLRWRSRRAALARRCGLLVGTADRVGGLCVLTTLRARVLGTTHVLLPKTPRLHQRAVVIATVEVDGARWRVATVHLSVDAGERARHLPSLWSALGPGAADPLVVAGDINEDPDGPVFADIAARLQDGFAVSGEGDGATSPARSPRRRIDAVFAERPIEVVSCRAVDVPGVEVASDHRPVLAVLRQP